jgi:alkaline phosphatase D
MHHRKICLKQSLALVLVATALVGRQGLAGDFPEASELPVDRGLVNPLHRIGDDPVTDPKAWPEQREYLKTLLAHYLYGTMPAQPESVAWTVQQTRQAVDRQAILEQVQMTIQRNGTTASVRVGVLRPDRPGSFPVIIKNDRFLFDTEGLSDDEARWVDRRPEVIEQQAFADRQAVQRGYVLVKFIRGDVATDAPDRRDEGVLGLYPEYQDWGVIAAWAWAYQPLIDALVDQPYIDPEKIVVTGHSRGGKAALCAGIYDDRIAITAPNSSGAGGTASWRFFDPDRPQQRLTDHQQRHAHWWTPRLMTFVGQEDRLPMDAHTLRAAVAPRRLINTHARHDWWANPYGTALAHLAAQPIFEWLGAEDHQVLHWRDGDHAQNEADWQTLFDFCDGVFFQKAVEEAFTINPHPDQYRFDTSLFLYRASTGLPISPYDFPYGYPFPDYPLAGASHPRQSSDYMRREPRPRDVKRLGQYALRLIQTDRSQEALRYTSQYLQEHPGRHDQEMLFMKTLAQTQLGDLDAAARTMQQAIQQTDLPPERFLAGPRRLFEPLAEHAAFQQLLEDYRHRLVHGPMLGSMTDHSVRVWVRTAVETPVRVAISRSSDMTDPLVFGPIESRAEDDYTAAVPVTGLEAHTRYHYAILLGDDGVEVRADHQQFRTFPARNQPATFRVAFGGGAGYDGTDRERMWDTIAATDPAAVLLMGDNVYSDDPESPDQQRYCYYQRQSQPEFARLIGSRSIAAIWDDHDFAMDDSWGGPEIDVPYWKPIVWDIFRQNFVNPYYGGGVQRPGVWFDFSIGDVHFLLLDGRYYRTDPGRFGGPGVERPTMLGPFQLAWLKQTLAESDATFKVLVSPVPWSLDAKPGQAGLDTWRGFQEEREAIFDLVAQQNIPGVVLISADRHRSDAWKIPRDTGYDLYEFSSSHLTNIHTHGIMDGCLFGYNKTNSFGLLIFDTRAEQPSVTYQIIDVDGQQQGELKLPLSQLQP